MNNQPSQALHSRRDFLQQSSLALAAAALPLSTSRAADAITSKKIRIGLIGCGGRGSGAAAQALTSASDSVLDAMGDVCPEQIEKSLAEFTNRPEACGRSRE